MQESRVYLTNIVLAIGLVVIYCLKPLPVLLYIAFSVLALTAIHIRLAKIIAQTWLKIGKVLGIINSRIILSLFYFLVLTPVSLSRKLFSKRKQDLKPKWITVDPAQEIDFRKMW